MFKIEDFDEYPILKPTIIKINKFLDKGKITKVSKLIDELEKLLDDEDLAVPITYVLSMIAEDNAELIEKTLIQKIENFLKSDNSKLRLNSIIILGFFLNTNFNYIEKFYPLFVNLVIDDSGDIRDNAHYFLQEFANRDPKLICHYTNLILKALSIDEKNKNNIISLLNYLYNCDILSFKQLFKFREVSKSLMNKYFEDRRSEIIPNLMINIKKFFPAMKDINLEKTKFNELEKLLDAIFLMRKTNFTEISKKDKNIQLKDFIQKFKSSPLREQVLYFYTNDTKRKIIYFYELEKDKFLELFNLKNKISLQKLEEFFTEIIENERELKLFMKMLIQLGHIKGFLSNFYFYPHNYLKSEIFESFQKKGMINLRKNVDFLPPKYIHSIVLEINQEFLMGKNNDTYYSLKKIQEQIIATAAKNSSIDLKSYREKLRDDHFIKLIKNLPKTYLTKFRKGTNWLTNIGLIKVTTEIENSKVIGFIDINKISEKLNIKKILLMDILELNIDFRSGIWDISMEIFYYSKYLQEKIDEINQITEESEKVKHISLLSKEFNIDKNHILTKIDENYHLIGEEIKSQDQIKISEYMEKTGFDRNIFMKFIDDLELNYFIKGDFLILSPKKIEESKKDIKTMIIQQSKFNKTIPLGNFDINTNLVEGLIKELQEFEKIKGIFYEEDGIVEFYTEKGIQNLMFENSSLFSFQDLFYEKKLSEGELTLIKEILEDLLRKNKLKGQFDEETLTFSSDEVLFANDYNANLHEFSRMINKYIHIFDSEFQKIKKILTKQEETIFPQEIKMIQDSIDKLSVRYVFWRDYLETFIREVNKKVLNQQGLTLKKYKKLKKETFEINDDIKSFEDDVEVNELMNGFYNWIKLFNELELKYPNIIFYQKRLIKNPKDDETRKNLDELLINLNLKI